MTLIGLIITFCIIPSAVNADCLSGNWTTRVATDGNTYGYQVLARDWLNFYEARALCLGVGGDVASIHSNAENEFVRQLAAPYIIGCQTNKTTCGARATTSLDTILSVVWLGMHRCQYFPSYNATVDCVNSDGTPCDYAATNAVILTGPSPFPWAWGNPSGSDSGGGAGLIEDCVSMYNATTGEWNDLSCFQKLGGVVCKRNCTGTCGSTSIKTALITSPSDITDTSCTSGNWTKRAGEDGNTYGYQIVMQDWLNFYEANAKCLALGAEVVSVHSVAENEFIRQLSAPYITACQTNTSVCATIFSSLWVGLHRSAFYPSYNSTVDCINSDGTICDYFNITGGPSGTETGGASGQQEACAAMYSATTGQWNDIACYNKLGGVICKKNCSKACGVASTTTTQLTTTTTQPTTTTTLPTTTTTLPTTTTTEPSTTTTAEPTTTTTEPSTTTTAEPTTTTTEPSTTTTAEPTTTTTEPSTTTTFNCAQPPVTSLLSYNTSDPKIQTGSNATQGVCECPADPGNSNVFFIPVTTITTGSSASNSSVIMKCSKMQDFCICDEDDICWKVINAYSLVVINSFCDPTCHNYARLQNAAPFNQTFESDCGRRITLADELTPIPNTNRNTFKPLGSSADYYIKAASIRCLQAGQTCTPIKCSGTRKPSPCPTTTTTLPTTTTTLPTTTTTLPTTTTTLPTTTTTLPTTTTTLPTTTTTLPTTTTTLPTTTTTLPTTTTTLPTTTTTLPTTTTTLPTTTTTLPTTTTTLPTTTTKLQTTTTTLPTTTLAPLNCGNCATGQSRVIYDKNTLASNQIVKNNAASQCIFNCKDPDVSQICYSTDVVSVARINCTDPSQFCVCASNVKKGCYQVTNTALLADYSIFANASSTFLVINSGSSNIANSQTGASYKFTAGPSFVVGNTKTLNAPVLGISCNGCAPIHNPGADVIKPCTPGGG
uniref:C-type lectin domain-containing protein n=1 Tax=Meloidogyne incognita TaxID=6306 RepID=A0A914KY93_MELIC